MYFPCWASYWFVIQKSEKNKINNSNNNTKVNVERFMLAFPFVMDFFLCLYILDVRCAWFCKCINITSLNESNGSVSFAGKTHLENFPHSSGRSERIERRTRKQANTIRQFSFYCMISFGMNISNHYATSCQSDFIEKPYSAFGQLFKSLFNETKKRYVIYTMKNGRRRRRKK